MSDQDQATGCQWTSAVSVADGAVPARAVAALDSPDPGPGEPAVLLAASVVQTAFPLPEQVDFVISAMLSPLEDAPPCPMTDVRAPPSGGYLGPVETRAEESEIQAA